MALLMLASNRIDVFIGAELYKEVKRATDSSLGIPSQCVVASKAGIQYGPPAKPRVQYCAKYDPAVLHFLSNVVDHFTASEACCCA